MSTDIQAVIKRELAAGKSAPEIREVLKAYGEDLDDHYDLYFELQKEVENKASAPVTQFDSYGGTGLGMMTERSPRKSPIGMLIKMLLILVVLGVAVVFALGEGGAVLKAVGLQSDSTTDGLTAEDVSHQAALKSHAATARIYKNKLLDYGGVCSAIGLDLTVYRCTENLDSFAIETKLSTGEYYCVDSTDFSGVTLQSYGSGATCLQ